MMNVVLVCEKTNEAINQPMYGLSSGTQSMTNEYDINESGL